MSAATFRLRLSWKAATSDEVSDWVKRNAFVLGLKVETAEIKTGWFRETGCVSLTGTEAACRAMSAAFDRAAARCGHRVQDHSDKAAA